MKGTGSNLWFKSTPTHSSLIAKKGLVTTTGMCFLGQRGHREGIVTSGTLCAHQECYFRGEQSVLGKSNLLYSGFEQILTAVYGNIPNCK